MDAISPNVEKKAIYLAGVVALGLVLIALGFYVFKPYSPNTKFTTIEFASIPQFQNETLSFSVRVENHSSLPASYELVMTSNDRFLGQDTLNLSPSESQTIDFAFPLSFELEQSNWIRFTARPAYGDANASEDALELLAWYSN